MPIDIDVKINLREHGPIVRSAVVALSKSLREKSRQNLSGAGLGKFGANAYTTKIRKLGNIGYAIDAFLKPRFLKVFETGGTSVAKGRGGLLWIPVPPLKIKARKYGGKLFRLPGTNVLVRPDRRIMFIGVKSITNRKRLGLETIAMVEASKFVGYMREGIYDGGKSAPARGSP